jgi:hypothetical protein
MLQPQSYSPVTNKKNVSYNLVRYALYFVQLGTDLGAVGTDPAAL